ncbi:MAG: DUF1778 domain-containing protein [Planctomycetia bacterium]|mgnify:CR=1 FL=1|nr:DUF1778 domain-containing protein [Planctomycetia bacterium]
MTLQLHLTPELELLIRNAAISAGEDVEAFVLRAVQERVAEAREPQRLRPGTPEWNEFLNAWLATHQPVSHIVDDSRESIYE